MSIEAGSVVDGIVSKITAFGAFVELPEGKTGLVHISEVADVYVNNVRDFLTERDKVKVKVLSVDDRGKIALSIKQVAENKSAGNAVDKSADSPASNFVPRSGFGSRDFKRRFNSYGNLPASFEDKLSKFMKDSDERQTDLRRKTDSKRGGRGSRRG